MNKTQKSLLTAAAVAAAAAAPFAIEAVQRRIDRTRIPAPGQYVDVGGRKMHVYSEGEGEQTIVFLPGLGTPCPAIDFGWLTAGLHDRYRCVIPEPFGYGHSDHTTVPRTIANYVGELREGLQIAGFEPPYILLGHSIAGLYMLWWAAHYPSEVETVIGIDTTVPEQIEGPTTLCDRCKYYRAPLFNAAGISRLLDNTPRRTARLKKFCGGDAARLNEVAMLSARNTGGFEIIDELFRVPEHCVQTQKLRFPKNCNVLNFVALNPKTPSGVSIEEWVDVHQRQSLSVGYGRCVALEGKHYLHWTQADEMIREILDFLAGAPASVQAAPKARRPVVLHRAKR